MKSLIFTGPQGSGKGTQAKILAEKFGYVIFETGAALRKIAQKDTKLGKEVLEITTRGDLVPNDIVMKIVANFLQNNLGKPIIFDGIPRSTEQRESLETLLNENGIEFQAIEIALSINECMVRLMKRAEIEGRADDTPEAIRNRLKNFFTHTEPLLEYWGSRGKLVTVDGNQTPEMVDKEIVKKLGLV